MGATGRHLVRVSLGSVRAEAEIRGHRRSHIGSMPDTVIQSIREAKSSNPLLLLDGADKLGADFGRSERANKGVQKGCDANSRKSNDFLDLLFSFPEPAEVAKISAYYSGGGMNLAGCCDLGSCKEDARFGVPAAEFGLGYDFELIRQLPERVGLPSLEMIYTGFSAQQAFDMGLVQRLVADSERDTAETTALITQNAALTIALAKAGARQVAKPDTERNFAPLDAMVNACFDSRDYGKGRCSFTEKRRPNFKNE